MSSQAQRQTPPPQVRTTTPTRQADLDIERLEPVWNTSGLWPLGHAVLVETYEPEVQQGLIQIPDAVKNAMHQVDQRAVVIALGPNVWADEAVPRAKPGDRVLVTKYAGFIAGKDVTKDGKMYRLVNDRDIFCRIE